VLQALLTIQANQTVVNNLPEDVRMKDPPRGGTADLPITAPVLLDAWGNPIIYAPRRAKPSPNPASPPSGLPPADSTLVWGLRGLYFKTNPGVEHYYEPPDGKGVFVSAGPDGVFGFIDKNGNGSYEAGQDEPGADDNIYSDDSGKVYTGVVKP
jgi:hypothetical protein